MSTGPYFAFASACSFWPYAHMAVVSEMESKDKESRGRTFDLDFAMNVLACSMPFSVLMIMLIYSSGSFFTAPAHLFESTAALFAMAALPVLIPVRKSINKTASA